MTRARQHRQRQKAATGLTCRVLFDDLTFYRHNRDLPGAERVIRATIRAARKVGCGWAKRGKGRANG